MPFDNMGAMLGGGAGFTPSPAADEFLKAQAGLQAGQRPGFVNPAEMMPTRAALPQIGERPAPSEFNPYGGPGLGHDIFSQGLSTLGKMPTMHQLEANNYVNTYEPEGMSAGTAQRLQQGRMAAAQQFGDLLGKFAGGSEAMGRNQLGAGDLALRAGLGGGDLAVKQAAESRLQHGEANKTEEAFIASQLAKGVAPESLAASLRAFRGQKELGGGRGGMLPPTGGSDIIQPNSLGGGKTTTTIDPNSDKLSGTTGKPWSTEQGDLMEAVHQKASHVGMGPAGPVSQPPSIGEFLQALDVSHPGMIRQNPDTVMSWARDKFQEKPFQDWFQGATGGNVGNVSADEGMRQALHTLMAERGNQQQYGHKGRAASAAQFLQGGLEKTGIQDVLNKGHEALSQLPLIGGLWGGK